MTDLENSTNDTVTSILKQVFLEQQDEYEDLFQNEQLIFDNNETPIQQNPQTYERRTISCKPKTTKEQNNIFNKNFMDFSLTELSAKRKNHKQFKTTSLPNPQSTFATNINIPIQHLIYQLNLCLTHSQSITEHIFIYFQSNFIDIIKTQLGSNIIKTFLPKTNSNVISQIFSFIIPSLPFLLYDQFASSICVQLFFLLSSQERLIFLYTILPQLSSLIMNNISTHSVQCIISNLVSIQEKEIIFNNIYSNLNFLAFDMYGCHVIDKMLLYIEDSFQMNIMNFIISNFVSLACNINGLCLAKKAILIANQNKLNYYQILKCIINENCLLLMQNPYANYAMQVIIDNWKKSDVLEIINKCYGSISLLSVMKYSSNVIEKLLITCEEFLGIFIKETCIDKKTIGKIVKDSYGNYVVQTALRVSNGKLKMVLINEIENNLHELVEMKLIQKWKHILAESMISSEHKRN